MKRSEMVEKVVQILSGNSIIYTHMNTTMIKVFSDRVLKELEVSGMQPPQGKWDVEEKKSRRR